MSALRLNMLAYRMFTVTFVTFSIRSPVFRMLVLACVFLALSLSFCLLLKIFSYNQFKNNDKNACDYRVTFSQILNLMCNENKKWYHKNQNKTVTHRIRFIFCSNLLRYFKRQKPERRTEKNNNRREEWDRRRTKKKKSHLVVYLFAVRRWRSKHE